MAACAPRPGGEAPPPPAAPAPDPATASETTGSGLELTMSVGPATRGAPVRLELVATNRAEAEIVLDFPDGQRFDFEILDDRTAVWRWSEGMFFPQVLGRERIGPGESLEWTAVFEEGLAAGSYRARGTVSTTPPFHLEVAFEVGGGGPGGAGS